MAEFAGRARLMGSSRCMRLNPGDHICALYRSDDELAGIVADFLADGLRRQERCWYLPHDDAPERVVTGMAARGIDVDGAIRRGAFALITANKPYQERSDFNPEETMRAFNSAIEQALSDGFGGFRAAANMSWALDLEHGTERVIVYEALLRSLFSTSRATGLCLYDAARMPPRVLGGALCTHPIVHTGGDYARSELYDPNVQSLAQVNGSAAAAVLTRFGVSGAGGEPPSP
jgi:hypothetical protein